MGKFTIIIGEKVGIKNMVDKKEITAAEAGRRGGKATLENQGPDFFKKIGRKGGTRTAELYREALAEFGRKGGRPRRPALD